MESFAIPGVGGIVEKTINGTLHVLLQERYKAEVPEENGLFEIPSGKIRAFENIFEALSREIKEETGLDVVRISGENLTCFYKANGYDTVYFTPFSCTQNLNGSYPILVMVFICKAEGELTKSSEECKNHRWVSVSELDRMLKTDTKAFYPMHVTTLKKYSALYKAL